MDWQGLLGSVASAVTSEVAQLGRFARFVRADRDEGMKELQKFVTSASVDEIDAFDAGFLKYSSKLSNPEERMRAMELYAWFKLQETLRFQSFRGFPSR